MANRSLRVTPATREDWKQLISSGRLYAVVDSCNEPSVPPKVEELGPQRAVSLYRGSAEEQYASVAPYLIHVDDPAFDWIGTSLWAAPWGIFVVSEASLEVLRTHFRHFLKVLTPDRKEALLRFYDPRILPAFLKGCDDHEVKQFFGPVQGYGVKEGDNVTLLRMQ